MGHYDLLLYFVTFYFVYFLYYLLNWSILILRRGIGVRHDEFFGKTRRHLSHLRWPGPSCGARQDRRVRARISCNRRGRLLSLDKFVDRIGQVVELRRVDRHARGFTNRAFKPAPGFTIRFRGVNKK